MEALLGYELVQVSCGASHVLAVTNEREVFAWGRGDNGKVTNTLTLYVCDSIISAQSVIVGSVFVSVPVTGRSPWARHPRHTQLSTAGVFTCGI